MYSKPNFFGVGPTKLALMAHEIMKKEGLKSILELGCGQGRDCTFFAESGYSIKATDFSIKAINFVQKCADEQKLDNLTVKKLDLTEGFNIDEKFDCVYSNLAFQFFNESELSKIFQQVSLCLKKNGLFIFSTKKPGDKYHKVGQKINENAYQTKNVIRYFFDKKTIYSLLDRCFKIERFGEETHENLDKTISAWWHVQARKL